MTTGLAPPLTRRARLQNAGQRRPLVLVMLGVLLYSTGPVLVQGSAVSGPVFSFWRLWIGVPILGLAALMQLRAGASPLDRAALRWPLWAGLAFGAHQLLFMSALKATTVTDVSLMNTLSPIVVTLVAVPLFREQPSRSFRAWSVLAMTGAAVVVLGASSGPEGDPVGMALALLNVGAFAAFFVLSKLSRPHIDVLPFLFGVMIVAALTVSAFVAAAGEPVTRVAGRDLLFALVVAAGPGALGHFVMTWPLRWVPANIPPVMRLAQPVLSGALAFVFLGEPVTVPHVTGGLLTIAGVCGALLTPSARRFAAGAAAATASGARDASAESTATTTPARHAHVAEAEGFEPSMGE